MPFTAPDAELVSVPTSAGFSAPPEDVVSGFLAPDHDLLPTEPSSGTGPFAPPSDPNGSTPSVDPLKLAQWQMNLARQVQNMTNLAMAEWAQQPRPQSPGDDAHPSTGLTIDPRSLGAASNFGVPTVNAQPPPQLGDQLRQAQIDRVMTLAKTPDQRSLAQHYAADVETPALPTPSPLGMAVASPFAYAGRMAKGLVEDAAEGWGGQNVYGAPLENFAAAASSPTDFKTPLPLDQQIAEGQDELREEEHPILAAGPDVSLGVARAVPKIAAVALAPATLPAQMGTSGLLFGLDDDGNFSVKDAGLAALMPGAGAVTRVAAGKAIAAGIRTGVPMLDNPVVQTVLTKAGDQLAMNATMLAMQSPELAQLWQTDPDKFWQAVGATVGQNLAFAFLPHTGKSDQSEIAPSAAPSRETSRLEPGTPDEGAAASGPDNEPPAASSETAPAPIPEALASLQSVLRGNQGDALSKPQDGSALTDSSVDANLSDNGAARDKDLSSGSGDETNELSTSISRASGDSDANGPVADSPEQKSSGADETIKPADAVPKAKPSPSQADMIPPSAKPETPPNQSQFNLVLSNLGEERPAGLNATWLEANLGDLRAQLPGAPEVKVVQSIKELPEPHRAQAEQWLKDGRITKGVLGNDGKAYLVAENLTDVSEARKTYLEETLGHAGMEPLVKPGEMEKLYDLIWRGAPQQAAEIAQVYRHNLNTRAGRADFVGEFVAKASKWRLQKPTLWQQLADVLRRLAYRVGWLRNIAPSQVLDAQMRGLARRAALRLGATSKGGPYPNRQKQSAAEAHSQRDPTAKFNLAQVKRQTPNHNDPLNDDRTPTDGRMQNSGPAQAGGRVQNGGRTLVPSEPNLAEAPTKQTKQSNQTTDAGTTVPPASDFNSNSSTRGEPGSVSEPGSSSGIADQLADKLEAFKSGIKPGGPQMHVFGLAADLWDRAISMAQAVIRAGGSVGHAIDAAIRHIQENHQGAFDEDSVRGFLKEKLGGPETAPEPSTPPLREPTKNDNYEHSNETGTNEDKTSESHTADEGTASPDGSRAADATAYLERTGPARESNSVGPDEIDRQATRLSEWAKSTGAIIQENPLGRKLAQGAEHEVFVSPDGRRVIKRTYPGTFGVTPDVKGVQRAATPLTYLRRLALMNRVFGADLRLEGIALGDSPIIGQKGKQPAMVVSQRYVMPADPKSPHPSSSEISDFMRAEGFQPKPKSYFGWERPADGISVLDARPDNFIKTSEGVVPVDLVMDQKGPDAKSSGEAAAKAKGQSALTPGEQSDLKTLQAMQKGTGLNPAQAARLAELQARSNLAGAPPPHQLDLTPTIERKLMPDGTPREQWRQKQIRKLLDSRPPAEPGERPTIIFMAGGPGAGKSSIRSRLIEEGEIDPERTVTVAADDFKEGTGDVKRAGAQGIPEYHSLLDQGYEKAASVVHAESADMADAAVRQAIKERRNVVYDATMYDYEWGAQLIRAAKQAGYKTIMLGVAIDPEVAWQRAEVRRAERKRGISEEPLKTRHVGYTKSFPRYLSSDQLDEVYLWDNNGKEPRLILQKTVDGVEIHDQKAYSQFIKGKYEHK